MAKADELRAWALAQVGCGYVWGARGEVCTEALLARLQAQYPDQTNITTACRKWLGKRAYDCATLVRYGLDSVEIAICSGASSQWKGSYWAEKGPLSAMPRERVCILYNESASASPMGHTGIYLGDGYAVDARSSAKGVIRSALGSRTWSHYAIPKGLYDSISTKEVTGMQATVVADCGQTANLRERPDKTSALIIRMNLGSTVTVEEQADEWSRVVYGNVRGYVMSRYLQVEAARTLEERVETIEKWIAAHDGGGVQG